MFSKLALFSLSFANIVFNLTFPKNATSMLKELILELNKEEIRHYKLVSNSIKKTEERSDFELFAYIKNEKAKGGEAAFRQKFYANNANAFYRLKNRLFTQISKSILLLHNGSNQHHEVLENLLLSKIFYQKEAYKLAHLFLKKAEKKAVELDNYDYLALIYRDLIKLSYEVVDINPEALIEKQKAIYAKQEQINELNNVLAMVNHQLRRTQNLSKGSKEINSMLEQVISRYASQEQSTQSYQFQYAIYQAITQFLLQDENYSALKDFVLEKYKLFGEKGFFSKNNHDSKLQMITFIVNACFKTGDSKMSLQYTEMLYDEMMKFNNLFYHKYLFFYYQSLVINFSQNQPEKAKRILNDLKDDREFVSNPYYLQFIHLNLALLNYDMGFYNESLESINELIKSKFFADFDGGFRAQVNMLKAIIMYQNEQFEDVVGHLKNTLQSHNLLKTWEQLWCETLVLLASRDDYEIGQDLKHTMQENIKIIDLERKDDIGIYDFSAWFKSNI